MRLFEDTQFRNYLQALLDSKAGTKFKIDEREIDWKLAYEAGHSLTVREWAKRWKCSPSTAHTTLQKMEELVASMGVLALEKAYKTHPRKTDKSNKELDGKPNKKTSKTSPKTTISEDEPNTETNGQPDTEEKRYNITHPRAGAHGFGINTQFIRDTTTGGSGSDHLIDCGKGSPFSLKDVEGKVLGLCKQNPTLGPALQEAKVTTKELALDIFYHYGKNGGHTVSGQPVTKKNLFFIIGAGWIQPRLKRLAKGESAASIFTPTYTLQNVNNPNTGSIEDSFNAAFAKG